MQERKRDVRTERRTGRYERGVTYEILAYVCCVRAVAGTVRGLTVEGAFPCIAMICQCARGGCSSVMLWQHLVGRWMAGVAMMQR